jgi:predicted nuclease of restriction endonuclease-like (RecB) superfamily
MSSSLPSKIISNIETIKNLKSLVKQTRISSILKINSETIKMNFDLGKELAQNIDSNKGSVNIVREASKALIEEFGKGVGYGERSLKYCIKFYREAKDDSQVQQLAALLPWWHTCTLLDKVKDKNARLFYFNYALKNNCGREVLEYHIKQERYEKEQKIIPSNFELTLGGEGSELMNELLTDDIPIEIIGAKEKLQEKDVEKQIINNIKNFLINLGEGFCYIGNQNGFQYDDEEYITDLLFFNRNLKCLFAIELKMGKFKPEYLSKFQWYLHLLDTQMKLPDENKPIGIILCGSKNDYQVKALLDNINVPIGVATHKLIEKVEKELQQFLPETLPDSNLEK